MLPEEIRLNKNITSYVLYAEDDKPICAYRRIDNTDEWTDVTSEVLKEYNDKIEAEKAAKLAEKENKKAEKLAKDNILASLEGLSKEEQISKLREELAKLQLS